MGNIYRNPESKEHPDKTLDELIKEYDTSEWEAKMAQCFLNNRQRELETIRSIIWIKEGIIREELGNGNGNKCRFTYPYTLEYVLRMLPNPDKVIKGCQKTRTWSEKEIMKAGALYKRFVDFVGENKEKKVYCFLVRMEKMDPEKSDNRASIAFMDEGKDVTQFFQPPTKVQLPEKLEVFQDKIEFSIQYNTNSSDYIKHTDQLKVMTSPYHDEKDSTTEIFPIPKDGNIPKITIRDLRPARCYTITLVAASSGYGYDGVTSKFGIFTNAFSEPTNFKLSEKTDQSLTVSWLPPEFKVEDKFDSFYYEITVETEGSNHSTTMRLEKIDTNKIIEGLESSTKYTISIETKTNIKKKACPTDYIEWKRHITKAKIKATTRPATLSEPTITEINETSAIVSWENYTVSSRRQEPPIPLYTLEYRRINPNTSEDFISGMIEIRQTEKTSRTLANLAAGASYKIKIKVEIPGMGESGFSPAVIFTTVSLANKSVTYLRPNLKIIKAEEKMKGIIIFLN